MDDDIRFTLRLPASLHAELLEAANRAGSSLNRFMSDALAESIRGPGSVEVALRQASGAIRTANSLLKDERRKAAEAERERRRAQDAQGIIERLAASGGVTREAVEKAWADFVEQKNAEYAAKELERTAERRAWLEERLQYYQENLEFETKSRLTSSVEKIQSRIADVKRQIAEIDEGKPKE